ncbi:hypothetical protein Ct9H90mP29_01520 [bacterium]|nr:MAG: hypothetical protein Ct9H90mP29_01520 [bacterium]
MHGDIPKIELCSNFIISYGVYGVKSNTILTFQLEIMVFFPSIKTKKPGIMTRLKKNSWKKILLHE